MSKVLVGIVTYGGLPFTQQCIKSIRETAKYPLDIAAIIGKSWDADTATYLDGCNISYKAHYTNLGFPYGLNDLYDFAWKEHDYDYLIIAGNDIIAYPNAIDSLIEAADTTDYECFAAAQYDVKGLVRDFPECAKYFDVANSYKITDFSNKCWEIFKGYDRPLSIDQPGLSDIHNLALYKKSVMDLVGYINVNYFPAYYSDNDYARRLVNAKAKSCTVSNAVYFHFWSRTINQEGGASDGNYFEANRRFYIDEWGGEFGSERFQLPFNGQPYYLTPTICLPGTLKIDTRENELEIIKYWKAKHG